jgi:hypothetical protein
VSGASNQLPQPQRQQPKSDLSESSVAVPLEGDRVKKKKYRLFGVGTGDIPFRLPEGAPIPNLKNDDDQRLQPQEVFDTKAQVFDLSVPADLENYNKIVTLVGDGRAMISKEEVNWSSRRDNYVIFLRWMELFVEMPDRPRI